MQLGLLPLAKYQIIVLQRRINSMPDRTINPLIFGTIHRVHEPIYLMNSNHVCRNMSPDSTLDSR